MVVAMTIPSEVWVLTRDGEVIGAYLSLESARRVAF